MDRAHLLRNSHLVLLGLLVDDTDSGFDGVEGAGGFQRRRARLHLHRAVQSVPAQLHLRQFSHRVVVVLD